MQISIEAMVSIIIVAGALVGIYVKMQVDNALHKEKTAALKANIEKLEVRLSDHEEKMEEKIDKLLNSVNDIKTTLGKITK
jgi:uncharacterized membrane protein (DUF106 family)